MTSEVLYFREPRWLRKRRDTRGDVTVAIEPRWVTARCGFLFVPTPWRNPQENPPPSRLLELRARKARRKIRAERQARKRACSENPGLLQIYRSIAQLRRYYASIKRQTS